MDNMDEVSFDLGIRNLLEETFQAALLIGSAHSKDQIKLMILAANLDSLAKTFLLADMEPERVTLNLKQVALGMMGSSDWIREGLEVV